MRGISTRVSSGAGVTSTMPFEARRACAASLCFRSAQLDGRTAPMTQLQALPLPRASDTAPQRGQLRQTHPRSMHRGAPTHPMHFGAHAHTTPGVALQAAASTATWIGTSAPAGTLPPLATSPPTTGTPAGGWWCP
jgi:hypothetical protein